MQIVKIHIKLIVAQDGSGNIDVYNENTVKHNSCVFQSGGSFENDLADN